MMLTFPIRLSVRFPISIPVILPGMLFNFITFFERFCGSKEMFIEPLLLPYAEFGPKLTYA